MQILKCNVLCERLRANYVFTDTLDGECDQMHVLISANVIISMEDSAYIIVLKIGDQDNGCICAPRRRYIKTDNEKSILQPITSNINNNKNANEFL